MAFLHEPAWAKVNLYLHVVGRRADGYHLLDSLAVFPAIGDVLTAEPDDGLHLSLRGPFGDALVSEPDNLVLRAARALADSAGVTTGARLTLDKRLPIASGIGGGSADAAAALRLLSRMWGVTLTQGALCRIAAALGADVPVCLAQAPARMGGVGEVLTPAPALPACGMVLVNPGVAVATPAVFRAREGGFSEPAVLPARLPDVSALTAFLAGTRNDLEPPAVGLAPVIGAVLAVLRARPGCRLARMSGSGATCFGLFDTPAEAEEAAAALSVPGWWCWGGAMAASQQGLQDRPCGP